MTSDEHTSEQRQTERERRQQEELIRLATELARKDEIIAALQAANTELHDIAERWRAIAACGAADGLGRE